jgi:hypothetical protein
MIDKPMRIPPTNNLPMQLAATRAYGAPSAIRTAPTATRATAQPAHTFDQLIAGHVRSGINRGDGFDTAPDEGKATQNPLQMYSRATDRIEAATGVAFGQHLGLQIDVRG